MREKPLNEREAISPEITQLLSRWSDGDAGAAEELMPTVYEELRRLARIYLRSERGDHTLQATALVHEAYLRLENQKRAPWQNRAQFFAVASTLMRRILVDHARAQLAAKRGGRAEHVELDEALVPPSERAANLLALDDALTELAVVDARKSRVVELRFFGGLTVEETAETMGLNSATVRRDWTFAKAWLLRTINGAGSPA
ncbi:MAG: sigma-70 family RNA polymerase sigma factor [Chthoniobacterales bacterium]|nr:sigma-70 family RNA polymerase sigma factor [Chthoniobacterales bacterium]